jgi:hypothetical protein
MWSLVSEWTLVVASMCTLVSFAILLRIRPGPTLRRSLDLKKQGESRGILRAKIPRAVMRASRCVPGTNCLTRALATQFLLHCQGCHTGLQIGVAVCDHGRLQAHAWLEYEGKVLIGNIKDLPRFVSLRRLC